MTLPTSVVSLYNHVEICTFFYISEYAGTHTAQEGPVLVRNSFLVIVEIVQQDDDNLWQLLAVNIQVLRLPRRFQRFYVHLDKRNGYKIKAI